MTAAIWIGAAVLAAGALLALLVPGRRAAAQAQVDAGAEPGLVSA